jgi:large subunit ribosomal protein L10
MMTRAHKAQQIEALSERFGRAKAAFIVDFKGMDVEQVTSLRKTLVPLNAEMKVVRNTLVRLALKNHPEAEQAIKDEFVGTNAVVFAYDDVSGSAKALSDFSKEVESLKLKSGVMEGEKLDANKIKYLSTLPSKEVLRAQLLGTLMAPASQFVRVLNAVPSGFLNVLNAYKDKKSE